MSDDVDCSWAFVDLVNSRQVESRRFGRPTKGRRRIQTTPMMVVDSANANGRRTAGRAGVLAHRLGRQRPEGAREGLRPHIFSVVAWR
jgi:hypothetical protein